MAPLIYVMGPSGVGKDSVLRFARAAIKPGEKVAFAHRYITRPPDDRHENYISLTNAEFDTRRDAGLFAFDWRAYELRYAVGIETQAWREAGMTVIVSGSREHYLDGRPWPASFKPVMITADPETLARRLAQRGRETAALQSIRLARGRSLSLSDPAIVTIDNSGPLEAAGSRLLTIIRSAL
jgi:ribose 1,5-bisphosphokinase